MRHVYILIFPIRHLLSIKMRTTSLLLYLAGFAACSPLASRATEYLAPLHGIDHEESIRSEYVVVFQPGYTLEEHFNTIGRNFSTSARFAKFGFGYRANLDDETRDNLVRRDPGVRVVESNKPVHLIAPVNSTDVEDEELDSHLPHAKRMYAENHSPGAPHGLQMITTGSERLDLPVNDGGVYDYLHSAGEGVQVHLLLRNWINTC